MAKLTLAKVNIDGKIYYVTPCNVLENELATSVKKIDSDRNVSIEWFCGFTILNNNKGFQEDLERIAARIIAGDKLSYYQGNSDKYYLTTDKKVKGLFDRMEANA